MGNFLSALTGALVLLVILAAFDTPADREARAEQQQYCIMWEVWHADRRAGLPVEQRYGWPDQAGRYYEECSQ